MMFLSSCFHQNDELSLEFGFTSNNQNYHSFVCEEDSPMTNQCNSCGKSFCSEKLNNCNTNQQCVNFDSCYEQSDEALVGDGLTCQTTYPKGSILWQEIVSCICKNCCEQCGEFCSSPFGVLTK